MGLPGAGFKAYGAYEQGQAAKNMYNYQAQAALMQKDQVAKVAEANITGTQNQASMRSNMLARNASEITGSQRASSGAQGLGSSVTAADVAKDTFTKQQMDQMTLQYNANVKAWNITNEANGREWQLGIQADQNRMAAKNAAKAGNIAAVTSLIDSAEQMASQAAMMAK